ncbi:MAG: CDF family Co(II)/Ni(II) efflux transporter DmeF [Bdellovibrionales bacterium]|nr:CDF family Co(II)/Ni(II) efflux transporter DmeF [Bdellovibrionales bacterium]
MEKTATTSELYCNQLGELAVEFEEIAKNERRTLIVVLLTAAMMVVEIIAGYMTGSMALLADGYHMASHAGALGIAYLVYRLARSTKIKEHLTFGSGKLLPLGGYSSAIGLGIIAVWMSVESIHRIFNPVSIEFNEAIFIAVVGLVVNLLSALVLGSSSGHHHHDHGDHDHHDHDHVHDSNHRSALMHVLADALTSVTAIVALIIGKYYSAVWLDPAMGVVGSAVILRWAYVLCKDAAWELLDGHAKGISIPEIRKNVEDAGHKVLDLHLWKVGPGNFSCQLIVESKTLRGAEYFRQKLAGKLGATHLVIEERIAQ